MKCKDCPYSETSKICQIKCDMKQQNNKKAKVPTRIKKVSDKRKIEDAEYKKLRLEFLSKPENQICPITKWQTTEVHHKFSGKDRAKYYLDTETWLAVSREGHLWIHDNPKEARELGYLN